MNRLHGFLGLSVAGLLSAGCVVEPYHSRVYYRERGPVYVEPAPVVVERPVVEQPVFEAPGVEVIEVEPAPVERVYVYDQGFPPGCYFYNDYYWYNGYRYPHDVFINRYVTVNVRERRFINVEENRRFGRQVEERHRQEFAVNHGVRPGARQAGRPAPRPGAAHEAASHQQGAPIRRDE